MRLFVKTEVFDTITKNEDIAQLRNAVGKQLEKIQKSGKLEQGWVATHARSPMFIFNVESAADVMELLGNVFIDNFKVEIHPIVGFKELAKFFEENPPGS